MNQKVIEYKESLLSRGGFRRVSTTQYRIQDCPICGDHKWHCYIKLDVSNDEPVLFKCFKCNTGGIVDQKFLEYLGITDISIPKFKFGRRLEVSETVSVKINEDTVCDVDDIHGICSYIKERVGVYPNIDDLKMFNYIGNPEKYVRDYLGDDIRTLKNRYWFRLTNGNMTGRWYNDDTDYRWMRYKSDRVKTVGLYKLNVPVDLYQPINVIIAEGVMDVIGLYYNYKSFKNNIYIAVMGKDYYRGIKYILDRGIFGHSVSIKIFKDSDVNEKDIYIDYNMKKLFNRVDIFENLMGKDYGVLPDELDIHKIIMR